MELACGEFDMLPNILVPNMADLSHPKMHHPLLPEVSKNLRNYLLHVHYLDWQHVLHDGVVNYSNR